MEETVKQVVKILRSPGCRYALYPNLVAVVLRDFPQQDPGLCQIS